MQHGIAPSTYRGKLGFHQSVCVPNSVSVRFSMYLPSFIVVKLALATLCQFLSVRVLLCSVFRLPVSQGDAKLVVRPLFPCACRAALPAGVGGRLLARCSSQLCVEVVQLLSVLRQHTR